MSESSAPTTAGIAVNDVRTLLDSLGFAEISAAPVQAYLELLLAWNRRMNLVGSSDWRTVLLDLIQDSFHLARLLHALPACAEGDTAQILDLGAGAGLPGIPLRMAWTAGTYRMVEIRQKRQTFLAHALGQLQLPRTFLFPGTAEAALTRFGRPHGVAMVVSRAFKPWAEVLTLVQSQGVAVRRGGFMANEAPPVQLPEGWRLERAASYCSGLPGSGSGSESERWLWVVASAAS